MRIFGHGDVPAADQGTAYDQIKMKLDSALTSVFTEDGKQAVLFYMTEKYSLTLEQASRDPGRLEAAMTSLLGEIGWMVVKRRILEQLTSRKLGPETKPIETASLSDAFGFARSFLLLLPNGITTN